MLNRAILVSVLVLGGCATTPVEQPPSASQKQRMLNEGYSMLYDAVSKQKQTDKLLLIKLESKEVKTVIGGLSDAAERIQKDLDEAAKRDPRLELRLQPLPEIEVEARKSANFERLKDLLGQTGKEFERLLLLTQSGALNAERHLAKTLSEKETDPHRKKLMQEVSRVFDDQYQKVVRLLEAEYFTPAQEPTPTKKQRK